jgi:hypothetical protein
LSATLRALAAERDALRAEVENAKLSASLLAFKCGSLASRAEAAEAKVEQARVDALREAAQRITDFLGCARVGVSEYIKGQDECAIYLRNEILALIDKEQDHD